MIRAAFATGDGVNINRHFGTAERFDVYEIARGLMFTRSIFLPRLMSSST